MKTSIATVSLSGDLADKLSATAAAGFNAVEIFENDFLAFDLGAREVGQMVRDAGLEISLFQPFRDFEGLPEPQRAKAFDRARRKFETMNELGTDLILICSSVSPLAQGGIDRAADDLRELGEIAKEARVRVGYEALAWGRYVNDHRDAWEIVRRADHPHVGLILDSFHTLSRGIDPGSIRSIPKDKIFIVQMADAPKLDLDLLSWSRHYRNMPGQGDLPVAEFMAAVEATGYDGYYSLEIFNDQFRAGSARQTAVDGRRSLFFLMDRLKAEGRAVNGFSEPEPLPPRARTSGVSFIEFATDGASATALSAMLVAIGFRPAGRHRSKDVDLFTQGDLRVVVNTETEGFAHSSYVVHGTNVCALGLRMADALAALARAEGLLAHPFRQSVGSGELELPAIRGVGGSLLHLVPEDDALGRQWETDFSLEPGWDAHAGAGLLAVDHIAQTVRFEDMLSWTLFYRSIFDLTMLPAVEVPDPGGLVRSQVLENDDGSLRIVLNGSQSSRTLSARFVSQFVGPGVQHVAFRTADILRTAEILAANGVRVLPIPQNYYDDVEAKFDVDADTLAAMRRLGILYDRDEAGEYFQIYLQALEGGFFIEIVERRGYAGLGAANASIRLATQSRFAPEGLPAR
ncbi:MULTISPECIES: bifunctional sugar phosphate isomerase/epimerase/4-hydroxyphenylpyruvate dioxygenase family protein [unclassified Aureimonas]|uniref:bifunctional sugar phosphate isomerase/epimerase/4-hydroxyphenylpyruvate dioxygenase family protein n=1 Tax=unclassified Aureimonas TaxID=2615206 RepID=UPI0006FECFCD|nr:MULTISPECIES: sugar phosphate isomerase/epimerase and 4-hydroxyphenylpyruvate domain-containing protein [unclassified Aureimonas]KQT61236.1 3-keto-5-aminohexanoate cleavage protein [Aureimonas sp. Leaf460]KQT68685.1 3-keto-5-aminohexanoate cleavage protein [Aureimonas sp. Leaf427]